MPHCNTIFSQVLRFVSRHKFESLAPSSYRNIFSYCYPMMVTVCDHGDGAVVQPHQFAAISLETWARKHVAFIILAARN
ncbi:hypothetical protein SAMN05421690_10631 [Nitrosomonas sp. Nm51]|nr:hypothetical protein SAMN05421690_10631 [Nitrosomonas sp. Nm51]